MPIKGMFNQKAQKKNLDEWEKQILRINTLEVQMKGLVEFEKKIRASMYRNSSGEKKEQERVKTQNKDFQVKSRENAQKFYEVNKRLEELGQRVYQLENFIEEKGLFHSNPLPREDDNKVDEGLIHLIEQLILEKYEVHFQRENQLVEKIQALENQVSMLKDREVPTVDQLKSEANRQTPSEDVPTLEDICEKRDEQEVCCTQIEMRVQLLEHNFLLINEVQVGLLRKMEELIGKTNVLLKQMDESKVSMKNEEPIVQTLYIDKLYLEKYEQNNNFAQLGIKNLSGALNIGATYGKEAIPKEITEQVKEDIEKMKQMKAEMENSQPSTDQSDDFQHDESSSEVVSNPSEENLPYTDIVIEDDKPPL